MTDFEPGKSYRCIDIENQLGRQFNGLTLNNYYKVRKTYKSRYGILDIFDDNGKEISPYKSRFDVNDCLEDKEEKVKDFIVGRFYKALPPSSNFLEGSITIGSYYEVTAVKTNGLLQIKNDFGRDVQYLKTKFDINDSRETKEIASAPDLQYNTSDTEQKAKAMPVIDMNRVSIDFQPVEEKEKEYNTPGLFKNRDGLIIFAISYDSDVKYLRGFSVVKTSAYSLGHWSDSWAAQQFTQIEGSVTLTFKNN